jgi:hypothetical protein
VSLINVIIGSIYSDKPNLLPVFIEIVGILFTVFNARGAHGEGGSRVGGKTVVFKKIFSRRAENETLEN